MATIQKHLPGSLPIQQANSNPVSGFIIGPVVDSIAIIGAPLVALLIAIPLYSYPASAFDVFIRAKSFDLRVVIITAFIHAHLFLVFFRSHGNPKIFWEYPFRFTVVPISLFLFGVLSHTALMIMAMAAIWWDVYHSSLQTFGFGRIYDAKQQNNSDLGRSLDYWMNLLIYTGPVLAGAHFVDHLKMTFSQGEGYLNDQNIINDLFLQNLNNSLIGNQRYILYALLAVGVPFIAYYFLQYGIMYHNGYRVSWQKIFMMAITSVVSIYCWGFRSFIDAFWVMNFFHALQYFAIVLFSEKKNLIHIFRVEAYKYGLILCSLWVISFSFLYGLWAGYFAEGGWPLSLTLTTSIMHFWYDGFVWSVKKKQV
jgi:hypothetical protein